MLKLLNDVNKFGIIK